MKRTLAPFPAVRLNPPLEVRGVPTVQGAGRGKRMGIPTVNLDLSYAPKQLTYGVYACWITVDGQRYLGAMHFGPRPVFKASESFEVHVIDAVLTELPPTVDVVIVARLRDVRTFESVEALTETIKADIAVTRAMLASV